MPSIRTLKRVKTQRTAAYIAKHLRYYKLIRQLQPGAIFETCGCEVARVVSISPSWDDISYEVLTSENGGLGSCSIAHCGPQPLTADQAERRIDIYRKFGRVGLTARYYIEDCKMTNDEIIAHESRWNSQSNVDALAECLKTYPRVS